MARVLQLPRAQAWKLAGENGYHDLLFQMEWLALADRSLPGLLADAANVRTEDDDALRWISRQRGAVLATLHMGPIRWRLHGCCIAISATATSSSSRRKPRMMTRAGR